LNKRTLIKNSITISNNASRNLSVIWTEYRGCFSINNMGVEGGCGFWTGGGSPSVYIGVKSWGCGWRSNIGYTANSVTHIGSDVKGCRDKMNTGILCYDCIWRPSSDVPHWLTR